MASKHEPHRHDQEGDDDPNFFDQRHQEASKALCVRRLSSAIHTSMSFATPRQNVRKEKELSIARTRGSKPNAPLNAYKKKFYTAAQTSAASILWLERKRKLLGKNIHHDLCGHGSERFIEGAPVDRYAQTTKTLRVHGCLQCFPNRREHFVSCHQTLKGKYLATVKRTIKLRQFGFRVIEKWKCEDKKTWAPIPKQETRT